MERLREDVLTLRTNDDEVASPGRASRAICKRRKRCNFLRKKKREGGGKKKKSNAGRVAGRPRVKPKINVATKDKCCENALLPIRQMGT